MEFKNSQTGKFEDVNQKFSESKNTTGERSYFRSSEADVKSDYGYNIQKDRISDNISKMPFKDKERNKAALQQMAHNVNKKSDVKENISSRFIEHSELIYEDVHALDSGNNIISKVDGEAAVLLQHSAHKDRKVARELHQVEKSARKEIDEIRKEEKSNVEFTESHIEFSNPIDKFDGKTAGDDTVNQFKNPVNHFDASDNRKGNEKAPGKRESASQSIPKDGKITVTPHEQEEKKRPAENNINVDQNKKPEIRFNESQVEFTDANDKFTNVTEKMFRKEMTDYKGNNIFISGSPKPAISNQMAGISSGAVLIQNKQKIPLKANNSPIGKKEQFMKDVPETNKSISSYFSDTKAETSADNYSSPEKQKHKSSNISNTSNTSKDTSDVDEKFMTKEERLDRAESKRKEAKSGKNKSRRKAASKAAFANVLMTKKNMQNNMENMTGEVSGDLIADGAGGLLQTLQGNAQSILTRTGAVLGDKASDALAALATGIVRNAKNLVSIIVAFLPVFIIVIFIISAISALSDNSEISELDPVDISVDGDGKTFFSLSDEEIDDIIESLYATYNNPDLGIFNMGSTQESILRYGLSKVGCPYNQNFHGSMTDEIFDCSSLAYRSYNSVGIDISCANIYSAAEECRSMDLSEKSLSGNVELLPGDLIFYGGANNQRYKGVYHVGIYVGNGKMVEAKGKKYGVVYGDVRTDDVVCIGRPWR